MSIQQNSQQQPSPANEQGFILIVTMLVLVVLTILCIGALDNSTFEVQIAANDRQSRVAFNLADGGAYMSAKLIGETLDGIGNPAHGNLSYVDLLDPSDTDYSPSVTLTDASVTKIPNAQVAGRDLFYSRVMGYSTPRSDDDNDGDEEDDEFDFMIRDPNNQGDIYGRVTRRFAKNSAGSNAEYASAALGAGAGSLGSTSVITDLDIDAYSGRNTRSQLAIRYSRPLGTPGGL